jgi:protein tyrosine phosphatase (PTP) superfamily phosphohydrolase (DUF442 family)
MDEGERNREGRRLTAIDVDRMPRIEGLRIPEEFYTVLDDPGRLAGMVRPSDRTPWDRLAREGFRYLVCLTDDEPPYDPSPVEILHAVRLEDLYGGIAPVDPDREAERIIEAVDRVVAALRSDDGVIVHCAGGTGRTGTVIGGVLRRFGHSADDVRAYLDRLHRQRGSGWPESSWPAALLDRIEPAQGCSV